MYYNMTRIASNVAPVAYHFSTPCKIGGKENRDCSIVNRIGVEISYATPATSVTVKGKLHNNV